MSIAQQGLSAFNNLLFYVMERPITRFEFDGEGDPIAILSCGHAQHVRHNPPFINRPWVTTEQGRHSMLGKTLNCIRCDKFELPNSFIAYKKTPVFTEESLPGALRKDHATRVGVWGKIIVAEGKLRYRVPALQADMELSQDKIGIVVPEVLHNVEPLGAIRFFVEFYKAPDKDA
jgi:tellurite methyltransferase